MKTLFAACIVTALCLGTGPATWAAQSGAKDEAKKAGTATKEAGKDTADAAKHVGKATAKGTKKGATVVKNAVTGDVTAVCKDGKEHSGKTKEAACADHGGLKK
jgi:urocanate hydratase